MGGWENSISDVFGLVVTLFVSGVVWVVLLAGSYQLVRDKIRQVRMTSRPSRRFASRVQPVIQVQRSPYV
jgi:hypothetical protein